MPLSLTCSNCHRHLFLDKAFLGAYCKCRYCGELLRVPDSPGRKRTRDTVRPEFPPEAPVDGQPQRPADGHTT